MNNVGVGYTVEVDEIGEASWAELLPHFADATIYQTWSYGAVRWGAGSLSHVVLKKDGRVIGAAQAALKQIPILKAGIAYIPWGPMWRIRGEAVDYTRLSAILRVLCDEYAMKRGLLLRITPNEADNVVPELPSLAASQGFVWIKSNYRTLLIDLSVPMDETLKGTARRWRRALKSAESNRLAIAEGTDSKLFRILVKLHKEMVARKGFVPGVDIHEFEEIQESLPPGLKMHIMIASSEGEPVAALAASLIGEKGLGLVGATSTAGLNMGGFQLLNWRMMEWLKQRGALWYDFGGYDPQKNPGTASFKDGLPGLHVSHVGQFEFCESVLSRVSVGFGERLLNGLKRVRERERKNAPPQGRGDLEQSANV